ncbi:MAG: cyclic nucleotide-binding domain-containing protein [Anaerolineae bacterium]|nr:MAG: cyclic nucleotide-binding domain-containing protein [Anaerolineae bacterium]
MLKKTQKLLQIQPGEFALVGFSAILFFFWEASREIGGQTATALFISRAGADKLPYMYIALGISSMAVSFLYTVGLAYSPPRWYFSTIAVAVILAVGLAYSQVPRLLESASLPDSILQVPPIYPLLWLLVNVCGTLLGTMAWSLAGQTMDPRQARRLFSLLASAGFLGAALAALIIRPLSQVYSDHVASLLIYQVVLVGLGTVAISMIPRTPGLTPSLTAEKGRGRATGKGARTVFRSPLLLLVAISLVLFSILFLTIDLIFNNVVRASLNSEAARLDFMAGTSAIIQILTLLTSIFLTGRLIKKWGVVNMNFFLILAYLVGFVLLILRPTLASAALARVLQLVTLGGIVQSSNYIFFNVIPAEKRSQAIAFTFGVVGQIGVVLSGILLLFGVSASSRFLLPILGITITLASAWTTLKMREGYRQALVTALRSGSLEFFDPQAEGRDQHLLSVDSTTLAFLANSLKDENPVARKLAAQMVGELKAVVGQDGLIACMADPDAEVRAAALRSLWQLEHPNRVKWARQQLHDPAQIVVLTAIEILIDAGVKLTGRELEYLTTKLRDSDTDVRLAAIRYFASSGNLKLCRTALKEIINRRNPAERAAGLTCLSEAAELLCKHGTNPARLISSPDLNKYLRDPSPAVRRSASLAAGSIRNSGALRALLTLFDDPSENVRLAAARAVREFGPGAERRVLAVLKDSQSNPILESALLALTPDKARHLESIRQFTSEEASRLNLWRQRAVSIDLPGRAAQLLHEIVSSEVTHSEVRLIRALQVLEPEDIAGWESIIERIKRRDALSRPAILEALDTLGDTDVAKNIVLPALEENVSRQEDTDDETNLHPSAVLQDLLSSDERWTRALAIAAIAELDFAHLAPEISRLSKTRDPIVRESANAALQRLKKGKKMARKSLQTLSSVERIILLRQVPIFNSLEVDDLKYLAEIASEKVLQSGEYLVRQNELGDELFIIAEGEVSIWLNTGKKEEEVSTGKEGDFFGEMSVLDSAPRSASILCTTPVRALKLEGRDFRMILRDRPEVSLTVLRGLSQRIRQANDLLKPQIDKTRPRGKTS